MIISDWRRCGRCGERKPRAEMRSRGLECLACHHERYASRDAARRARRQAVYAAMRCDQPQPRS